MEVNAVDEAVLKQYLLGDLPADQQQAVEERWERPQVRAAVKDCIAAIQQPSPRLASRIRSLTVELAATDGAAISVRTRRDLARLIEVAQPIAARVR